MLAWDWMRALLVVVRHQSVEVVAGVCANMGRKLRLETAVPGADNYQKEPATTVAN